MNTYISIRKPHIVRLITAAIVLFSLLILCSVPSFADITANESMRLSRTEGTVTVYDRSSNTISTVTNLKLLDGYRIETGKASYAWLTLDDAKAVKIDASSSMEVCQSGKQLELRVKSGNILVNVNRHLEADEKLDIRTSTMVVGIRGTSVVIKVVDEDHSQVQLLEGKTEITAADPVSGQMKTTEITSGQTADTYVYDQTKAGDKVDIVINKVTEENIAPFAAVELSENAVMKERIEANTELNVQQIITESSSRLEAEQKAAETASAVQNTQSSAQTDSGSDSYSYSAGPIGQSTAIDVTDSEDLGSDSGSGSSTGSGSVSGTGSTGNSESMTEPALTSSITLRSSSLTLTELQNALNNCSTVTLSNLTFNLENGTLNVPEGTAFIIGEGAGFAVKNGGTLNISGNMESPSLMTCDGTINVNDGGSITSDLTNNSGGSISISGTVDGDITNNNVLNVYNDGSINNGSITGKVTNNGSGSIYVNASSEYVTSISSDCGSVSVTVESAGDSISFSGNCMLAVGQMEDGNITDCIVQNVKNSGGNFIVSNTECLIVSCETVTINGSVSELQINEGAKAIVNGSAAYIANLVTLEITSNGSASEYILNKGTATISGSAGDIDNSGTLEVSSSGSAGDIENHGTATISGSVGDIISYRSLTMKSGSSAGRVTIWDDSGYTTESGSNVDELFTAQSNVNTLSAVGNAAAAVNAEAEMPSAEESAAEETAAENDETAEGNKENSERSNTEDSEGKSGEQSAEDAAVTGGVEGETENEAGNEEAASEETVNEASEEKAEETPEENPETPEA